MKIAIMQPYLFPYIGYFQLINAVDKFIIHDDVQYIKGGWINRNRILLGAKDYMFTFSLKKSSSFDLINNRQFSSKINDDKEKILRIIEYAYSKAPFYKDAVIVLKETFKNNIENVNHFIYTSIVKVCEYLDIRAEIIMASSISKDESLKGQQRVIELCKRIGANHYINPIGGIELYSKKEFELHDIQLNFLESKLIKYNQFDNDFVPNLSIIDVMMFNSKEDIRLKLKEYSLV